MSYYHNIKLFIAKFRSIDVTTGEKYLINFENLFVE